MSYRLATTSVSPPPSNLWTSRPDIKATHSAHAPIPLNHPNAVPSQHNFGFYASEKARLKRMANTTLYTIMTLTELLNSDSSRNDEKVRRRLQTDLLEKEREMRGLRKSLLKSQAFAGDRCLSLTA